MTAAGPVIWVDADACPVKAEVERVAVRHRLPVRMVCDGGLRPSPNPLITVVYVTEGLDAADDHIAQNAGPRDVVLTNDIPLADRAIAAGARVLRFDGEELTTRNIAAKLAARNAADAYRAETAASADLRPARGGPAFTDRDRSRFSNALERVVREVAR